MVAGFVVQLRQEVSGYVDLRRGMVDAVRQLDSERLSPTLRVLESRPGGWKRGMFR